MIESVVWQFIKDHSSGAGVSAVISALVSAGFGVLKERRDCRTRRLESIDSLLEETSAVSTRYWKASGLVTEQEDKLIHNLEILDSRLDALFGSKKASEHQDALDQLTWWITGGEFQTKARKPDVQRAATIKGEIKKFRARLQ